MTISSKPIQITVKNDQLYVLTESGQIFAYYEEVGPPRREWIEIETGYRAPQG